MAVAVADAEEIIDDTGDTYNVPSEPASNPLLLGMLLCTDNSSSTGTVTFTLGGQAFESLEGVQRNGGSFSPYIHSDVGWTTAAGTWPSTGNQTVVATATTGWANEGIVIVALEGVDQTTPVADFQSGKTQSTTNFQSFTITADNGDMVYWIGSCSSAGTINAPSAPGTNSWTTVQANGTSIIGGGLSKGSVYRMDVTQDIVSQSITATTTSTQSNLGAMIVVLTQSTGGGPTGRIMSSLVGSGGLAGAGGIAGPGGGLAGAQCLALPRRDLILPDRRLILPAYPTRIAA